MKFKKALAMLLAVIMLVGVLPVNAWAEEPTTELSTQESEVQIGVEEPDGSADAEETEIAASKDESEAAINTEESEIATYAVVDIGDTSHDIPVEGIRATAGDSQYGEGPERVLDGQDTLWHTNWNGSPVADHWITLDLGKEYAVNGLRYLPRQSQQNGMITKYEIWGSMDGQTFSKIANGDWAADASWKTASFGPYTARYIKLKSVQGVGNFASAAEIRITQAADENAYAVASFTEEAHSGWQVASGSGTMDFAENQMDLYAAGDNANTAYFDAESPALEAGFVEAVITPVTTERFALLYRYTDKDHYTGVSFDSGKWGWCGNNGDKWGNLTPDETYVPQVGISFTLRLVFEGANVAVFVNGTQVAHGTINDGAVSQGAGRVGFRLWGYGSDATRGHIKVSSVKMGTVNAKPLPEPEKPEKPVEPVDEIDKDGNYLITFTDAARRGGLRLLSGDGTVTFEDGEGDSGYALVAKQDEALTKAAFIADRAPVTENGFLEADVTNLSGGRLGLLLRVQDNGNYVGVTYDVGSWAITKNGSSNVAQFNGGSWGKNEKKHIRVDFAGTKITVTIDGTQVFSQEMPELADTGAGKVGAVVWGYSSGDNQGKAKIDNVTVGQRIAVDVSPKEYSLTYKEAGTAAMKFVLGDTLADNALTAVKIGDRELVKDTDYTLDGNSLRLEGSLITEEIKQAGGTKITLIFADGFEATVNVLVQEKAQETQINYVRDFTTDPTTGKNPIALASGTANVAYDAQKQALVITGASNAMLVDRAAPKLKNYDVEMTFNLRTDSGSFAVVGRQQGNNYVAAGPTNSGDINWRVFSNTGAMTLPNYGDGNQMFGNRTVPYKVRVRFLEKNAIIWVDNYEVWSGSADCLIGGNGLPGLLVNGAELELLDFRVTSVNLPEAEAETGAEQEIHSDKLAVTMDKAFPRVIRYTMDGKILQGQEIPYYIVEFNNKEYRPQVKAEFAPNSATYHLTVEIAPKQTVTFDVVYTVEGNVLQMKLKNIQDEAYPLYNINFPVQSLVSMSSDQTGAELRAANYTTAEQRLDLTTRPAEDMYNSASIVVLSNNELGAAINNESYNGHRGISYQTMRIGERTTTGVWSTGFPYRGLDKKVMFAEPWVKVAITGDRNADGKVDFQDAAIARRDDCQKDGCKADAFGYENVMGSYNTIAMNVGSAAQYPFLRILDNVKKMSLGLDDFPQTVIIKGYNGQGHDSNNNDFANYNQAAGGLKDFNTLLAESEKYNTKIGIHINETETYPESTTYGRLHTAYGGWPWYDVARLIHHDNDSLDASADGLQGRLDKLNNDTNHKLDLIYVDVYHKTRWPMFTLASKINGMGMAMATEYPSAVDKQSVWAHHVGGHVTQDNLTGNLTRFVNNQYQDIFGSSSLFRGTNRVSGINGWQNASNYYAAQNHFFTSVLPNRFLAQYPIMRWENANEVVLGQNMNVVTKMENGTNVITLDGREVARGNQIFIPYTVDGVEKIYHWNPAKGDSTWTLPVCFDGQTSVKVFKLTDMGRTEMREVAVNEGKVTISAEANTAYVIYKGDAKVENTGSLTGYDWGQGGFVKDAGFDSHTADFGWTVTNSAFTNNNHGNTYLVMSGAQDGSAEQVISGLTPGKSYQASVWAEVSGKTATIAVRDGETVLASNYMERSNVPYGIHHTDKYKRNLQRIWVEFTAPASGSVTLVLTGTKATGDKSYVNWDDVRIVEHMPSDAKGHDFYEDFEAVTEGYGPFVSTESDTSHLSETNAPYTFDTINGRFSLKTRAGDYMRTLPHTLRLKPNTNYQLGLQYIAGSAGQVFTVAVKSDLAAEANAEGTVASQVCTAVNGWGKNSPLKLNFTTGSYDDYYVEIKCNGSIREYAIDDFYVDEVTFATKESLQALYDECAALQQADYTPESWSQLTEKMEAAKVVLDKAEASQDEIQSAQDALQSAQDALVSYATADDIARLNAVIAQMKGISADQYAQDAQWEAFQNQIAQAQKLAAADKVTVPQVDEMILALETAKNELHSLINKDELKKLYDFCAEIPANDIVDGMEAVSFLNARTAAENILKDGNAKQADVNQAVKNLTDAYNKIVPKRTTNEGHVDAAIVTELAQKLAVAKQVKNPGRALKKAIAQAEKASKPMATWKAVVESMGELDAKIAAVTVVTENEKTVIYVAVGEKMGEALPKAPVKDGFTFTGWQNENGEPVTAKTKVQGDMTIMATWEPAAGIKYVVNHVQANIGDPNHGTIVAQETFAGTRGEMTQAAAKSYNGFTACEIEQKIIAGDGSTVVTVWYVRNTYTVTIDGVQHEVEFDAPLGNKLPENPEKDGFNFVGWQDQNGNAVTAETKVSGNLVITAQWKAADVPEMPDVKPEEKPETPDTTPVTPQAPDTAPQTPAATPATGDTFPMNLVVLLMLSSLASVAIVIKKRS